MHKVEHKNFQSGDGSILQSGPFSPGCGIDPDLREQQFRSWQLERRKADEPKEFKNKAEVRIHILKYSCKHLLDAYLATPSSF